MGWKNIIYLISGKQGRGGKVKSDASLEDGVKDPADSKKIDKSKDYDGSTFKYKEQLEAAKKARRESVPGTMSQADSHMFDEDWDEQTYRAGEKHKQAKKKALIKMMKASKKSQRDQET